MRHILPQLVDHLRLGQSVILAGIIRSSGSAPRTSGARMLVFADGSIAGTVGGGPLEGACMDKAQAMLAGKTPCALLPFTLNTSKAAELGMICGGTAEVLLQLIDPGYLPFFEQIQQQYSAGKHIVLITRIYGDSTPPTLELLGSPNCSLTESTRQEILRKKRRISSILEDQGQDIYVEPILRPGTVYFAGAGHVALATAQLADFTGFETVVIDDRAEFANAVRFPKARRVVVIPEFLQCFPELGQDDYVVIVTRGHLHDRNVLAQALKTGAGYIGMIGSRNKRQAVYQSLMGQGFTEEDIARVHCPIGLTIGADTPEEIAVSIVAELIAARSGKI